MSWTPPQSFGALKVILKAPLAFVVVLAITTESLSSSRPRKFTVSGRTAADHVSLAVDQVSSTFWSAFRPDPEIVIGVPATPPSGFTVRLEMVLAIVAGVGLGPGTG